MVDDPADQTTDRPTLRSPIYHAPAAVEYVRVTDVTGGQDWLARARDRALDPAIFDEHEPWFFQATISNNRLDAYHTRMAPSSLKNYADHAEAGVAFQDSHRVDGLERMLGRSLFGKFVSGVGSGVARTDAGFFTLRGLDPVIDTFEKKMRAGLARDVSIGFYGGTFRCSICGRDVLRDWDCPHLPGWTYQTLDKEGKPTGEEVVAFAWIEDANLAEASVVYDGATPGAALIAASRLAQSGDLSPEMVEMLRHQYRHVVEMGQYPFLVPSSGSPVKRAGAAPTDVTPLAIDPQTEESSMPPADDKAGAARAIVTPADTGAAATQTQPAVQIIATAGTNVSPDPVHDLVVRLGGDPVGGLDYLEAEITRLRPLARDGETYRTDLVAEAIAEGVRALGNDFQAETYRGLLATAAIETVKRMRDDWRAIGDKTFTRGRQSVDSALSAPDGTTAPAGNHRPPDAYRVS